MMDAARAVPRTCASMAFMSRTVSANAGCCSAGSGSAVRHNRPGGMARRALRHVAGDHADMSAILQVGRNPTVRHGSSIHEAPLPWRRPATLPAAAARRTVAHRRTVAPSHRGWRIQPAGFFRALVPQDEEGRRRDQHARGDPFGHDAGDRRRAATGLAAADGETRRQRDRGRQGWRANLLRMLCMPPDASGRDGRTTRRVSWP